MEVLEGGDHKARRWSHMGFYGPGPSIHTSKKNAETKEYVMPIPLASVIVALALTLEGATSYLLHRL